MYSSNNSLGEVLAVHYRFKNYLIPLHKVCTEQLDKVKIYLPFEIYVEVTLMLSLLLWEVCRQIIGGRTARTQVYWLQEYTMNGMKASRRGRNAAGVVGRVSHASITVGARPTRHIASLEQTFLFLFLLVFAVYRPGKRKT